MLINTYRYLTLVLLLLQTSLTWGIPVTFTWENNGMLPRNLHVHTTVEYAFSEELSCVQRSHIIDMNLEWLQAITHATIIWNSDKRVFPISKEALPTTKVSSWTINLN